MITNNMFSFMTFKFQKDRGAIRVRGCLYIQGEMLVEPGNERFIDEVKKRIRTDIRRKIHSEVADNVTKLHQLRQEFRYYMRQLSGGVETPRTIEIVEALDKVLTEAMKVE